MSGLAHKRGGKTAPLLGAFDRVEHAPGKAASIQRYTLQCDVERLLGVQSCTLGERLRHAMRGHPVVDPCAGDGAMLRHLRQLDAAPERMVLADIAESEELQALAGPGVDVRNPADMFTDLEHDPGVLAVITNWPWYGWNRHMDRVRELYPLAWICGISCDQERRDGDRPAWWQTHRPSYVVPLPGRRMFPTPGASSGGKYPLTTSWYCWAPGVSDDECTRVAWR